MLKQCNVDSTLCIFNLDKLCPPFEMTTVILKDWHTFLRNNIWKIETKPGLQVKIMLGTLHVLCKNS